VNTVMASFNFNAVTGKMTEMSQRKNSPTACDICSTVEESEKFRIGCGLGALDTIKRFWNTSGRLYLI